MVANLVGSTHIYIFVLTSVGLSNYVTIGNLEPFVAWEQAVSGHAAHHLFDDFSDIAELSHLVQPGPISTLWARGIIRKSIDWICPHCVAQQK